MKKEDQFALRHAIHQNVCAILLEYQEQDLITDRESVEVALNVWVATTKALRSISRQRKAAEAANVSTDILT